MRVLKVIGGLAVVAILFLAIDWTVRAVGGSADYTPCPKGVRWELTRPFEHNDGFSYSAKLPELADQSDSSDYPQRSAITVCEGGRRLGAPHALHADIVKLGESRFSHWGHLIYFSSSDNSDPNTNGRNYFAVR
jgi:hypothetical protein